MSFFTSRWIKKTRKPHQCWWCGERIELGQRAHYFSTEYDGDLCSGHAHPECKAAGDSLPYDEEGHEMGVHARGRTDDDRSAPPEFSSEYQGKQLHE